MSCDLKTTCCIEIPPSFCDQLTATMTVEVFENGPNAQLPTNIIRCDQSYDVKVCMELSGTFKKIYCGYWCVGLGIESCGAGSEFNVPNQIIDMNTCDPQQDDCVIFTIKGSDLIDCKAGGCGQVFHFCVTMVALDHCDKKPIGIAGFCKPGPFMVY